MMTTAMPGNSGSGSDPRPIPGAQPVDVLIVGAGFAGLYMLHKLRGQGLSAQVVEEIGRAHV